MIEAMGWLAFLVGWMTLLWIGGAIGETVAYMLRRSKDRQGTD